MQKRVIPIVIFILFFVGMAIIQFATPDMPDNDGFYHIKLAYLMRTEGIKADFSWPPLSILNAREFYDHLCRHAQRKHREVGSFLGLTIANRFSSLRLFKKTKNGRSHRRIAEICLSKREMQLTLQPQSWEYGLNSKMERDFYVREYSWRKPADSFASLDNPWSHFHWTDQIKLNFNTVHHHPLCHVSVSVHCFASLETRCDQKNGSHQRSFDNHRRSKGETQYDSISSFSCYIRCTIPDFLRC